VNFAENTKLIESLCVPCELCGKKQISVRLLAYQRSRWWRDLAHGRVNSCEFVVNFFISLLYIASYAYSCQKVHFFNNISVFSVCSVAVNLGKILGVFSIKTDGSCAQKSKFLKFF